MANASAAWAQQLVHRSTFDDGSTAGWTSTRVSFDQRTGHAMLGPFQSEPVDLVVAGMLRHHTLDVSFKLKINGSWDGASGPDRFSLKADGITILDTTFSNTTGVPQHYPGAYGTALQAGQTGAHMVHSNGDTIYFIRLRVNHSSATVKLQFQGLGLTDESWALDDVEVRPHVPSIAKTWGYNGIGELGQGTAGPSGPAYVNQTQMRDTIAVAAGNNHTVAIGLQQSVWTWGYNNAGQLGDGTTINRAAPTRVYALPIQAVAVAAGAWHSLALGIDGSVWAWGWNDWGQLGQPGNPRLTPVRVLGLPSNVTAIAAGPYHSVALTADGRVYAWGWNGQGQLGDGSFGSRSTPAQVPGLSGITAIEAGHENGNHVLALRVDGRVFAWGQNNRGQLGTGTLSQTSTPQPVNMPPAIEIAAGDVHGAAIGASGQLFTWGANDHGQLGIGGVGGTYPSPMATGQSALHVTVGVRHTYFLKSGVVFAVGSNAETQLGAPGPTTGVWQTVPLEGAYAQVVSAGFHGVALRPFVSDAQLSWPPFDSPVNVGSQAQQRLATFTNLGTEVLTVSGVGAEGQSSSPLPPGVITITSDSCQGAVLQPGGSCTFEMVFAPTHTGSNLGVVMVVGTIDVAQGNAGMSRGFLVQVVDNQKPSIQINSPRAGAVYTVGTPLAPSYQCFDNVGIASCAIDPGSDAINTSTPGVRTFRIVATDPSGNTATRTVTYSVVAGVSKFAWTKLNGGTSPSARTGHKLAYDSTRDRVILFGGQDVNGVFLNDTWEFDVPTRAWVDVSPPASVRPAPRAHFGMAYDAARDRIVMFGGTPAGFDTAGDTWEWNPELRSWAVVANAGSIVHAGLFGAELAYDPIRRAVLLFGGQPYWRYPENGETYALQDGVWTRVANSGPAGRIRHAMWTDPASGRVMLYGGHTVFPENTDLHDTWEWDGESWTRLLGVSGADPSPAGAAVAFDEWRGAAVRVGGISAPGAQEWTGTAWTPLASAESPAPRWTAMVYASRSRTLVLFGGNTQTAPETYGPGSYGPGGQGDTWVGRTTFAQPTQLSFSLPITARAGQLLSVTASLESGQAPVPGALVTFSVAGLVVGTATTDSAGVAKLTNGNISGLAVGAHQIQASFAGDPTYVDTTATATLTIIDDTPPTVQFSMPWSGAIFVVGQHIPASFTCADEGSGVSSCTGAVAPGALIDTMAAGSRSFTVTATDNAGNTTTASVNYTVAGRGIDASTDRLWFNGSWVSRHLMTLPNGTLLAQTTNNATLGVLSPATGTGSLFPGGFGSGATGVAPNPIVWSDGGMGHVLGAWGSVTSYRQDGVFNWQWTNVYGCCNNAGVPNHAIDAGRRRLLWAAGNALFFVPLDTGGPVSFSAGGSGGIPAVTNRVAYVAGGQHVTKWNIEGPSPVLQWSTRVTTTGASWNFSEPAITHDDAVVVTRAGNHAGLYAYSTDIWRAGEVYYLSSDGQLRWTSDALATTPAVIGGSGLIYVGALQSPGTPQTLNVGGRVIAYDAAGQIVWTVLTPGVPQDLFVGDDGRVYALIGGTSEGQLLALDQLSGALDLLINRIAAPWEVILQDGTAFVSGTAGITAIKLPTGFAKHYDTRSPWPVRQHDNERSGQRLALATLQVDGVSGTPGAPVTLTAALHQNGIPLAGRSISFSLFGDPAGTALTDSAGVARVQTVLPSQSTGVHTGAVRAAFAGDDTVRPVIGVANATVIDVVPPVISISSPTTAALYARAQSVVALFACTDASSAVTECTGTVSSGAPIDTSIPGVRTLTVTAKDAAGNTASRSVTYTVSPAQSVPATRIYVASWQTGHVSVYDGTSHELIATIPTNGARAIALSRSGRELHVGEGSTVATIDLNTNTVSSRFQAGRRTWSIAETYDSSAMYVTNLDDGTVTIRRDGVIKTIPTGHQPWSVLATPDHRFMLVSNYGTDTISVFDAETDDIVRTLTIPGRPADMIASPDGNRIFVASPAHRRIFVLDANTLEPLNDFDAHGDVPEMLALSPDGNDLYVTYPLPGAPTVKMNSYTGQFIAVLDAGGYPGKPAVSPHGLRAYTPSSSTGYLQVYDPATNTLLGRIQTGGGIQRVAISPLSATMFVEDVTTTYRGATLLKARLTFGDQPIVARLVQFRIHDDIVGTARTDATGLASLTIDLPATVAPTCVSKSLTKTVDGAAPAASETPKETTPVECPKEVPSVIASFFGDTFYSAAGAGAFLKVLKATPAIAVESFSRPYTGGAQTPVVTVTGVDGETLSASSITYNGLVEAPVNAGTYSVVARFNGDAYYEAVEAAGSVVITKRTSAVNWANPGAITYGTPLTAVQLAASSSVPGVFAYTPVAGTLLVAGHHTLSASFVPNDAANYEGATVSVEIDVVKAIPALGVVALSATYDGQPHPAAATVTGALGEPLESVVVQYKAVGTASTKEPAGAPVENVSEVAATEEDGWTTSPPIAAGFYEVRATYAGSANYAAVTTTGKLHIRRALPTVLVTDATFTYDGHPHPLLGAATGVMGDQLGPVLLDYQPGDVAPVNAGSYTVTASFAGNGNYEPGQATATLLISQATAQIVVTGGDFVYDGQPHRGTARAIGVRAEDLGSITVSYMPGDAAPVNAGSYVATATFAGTTNYAPAQGSASVSISKANATVAVTGGTFGYDGKPHSATAVATGVMGEDLGSVTLSYQPGGGVPSDAGVYSVLGTFAGNGNYEAATGTATVTIKPGAPTVRVVGGSYTYDGQAHPASGSVTGIDGQPLGQLTFTYSGSSSAPSSAGTYQVVGRFAGNGNYDPAEATTVVQIAPAPLTIGARDATKIYGDPNPAFAVHYSGFVGADDPGALTGVLAFSTPAAAPSPVGTYPVLPGGLSSNDYAITYAPGVLTVTAAQGVVRLASSSNPAGYLQSIALRADVETATPSAGVPTGIVEFLSGTTALGSSIITEGAAVINVVLEPGTHAITARYLGDANVLNASAALSQIVNDRSGSSVTTLRARPNPAQLGEAVTIEVDVSASGGAPTGQVQLLDGDTLLATLTLSGGRASFAVSTLSPGSHTLVARYLGESSIPASASTPVVVTVLDGARLDRTTVRLSPKRAVAGEPTEIEILVNGSGAAPFGSVVLYLDGGKVAELQLLSSGAAQASAVKFLDLTAGTHVITAVYGGSTTHAGSTGEIQLQVRSK